MSVSLTRWQFPLTYVQHSRKSVINECCTSIHPLEVCLPMFYLAHFLIVCVFTGWSDPGKQRLCGGTGHLPGCHCQEREWWGFCLHSRHRVSLTWGKTYWTPRCHFGVNVFVSKKSPNHTKPDCTDCSGWHTNISYKFY